MFTRWSVRRRLTMTALMYTLGGYLLTALLVTPLVHALLTEHAIQEAAAAAHRVSISIERTAPDNLRPLVSTENVDLIQVVDEHAVIRQSSIRLAGKPPLTGIRPSDDGLRVDATFCTDQVPGERCLVTVGDRIPVGTSSWMVYAYISAIPWYIGPLYVGGVLLGVVALSSITAAVASRTVTKALAPVAAIKTELAEITATDLGRRVPPSPHEDELDRLARTVNQTLDRLESAVEQQRRFASDASHDLRSPITAMRAQVEEALLHPEDADWEHTGQALLASLDRLQAIVVDLLTLAKLDAGVPSSREAVDLAALVEEELSRRSHTKLVELRLGGKAMVTGNRLQLARLLTNLLDNAERHAASRISVSVRAVDVQAVVEVVDDGGGIAPDQRETVFARFTRLDASRNVDAGGTGLGLPIARDIALAHGGNLTIEDSDRGARFVLQIPLRSS
ncbi:ATP-binding protein [Nonomuraea sp. NPDC005983]|uniref:sensor histidine kinase n=1 Tax=Nonomuraea sp. NPDC005983 TaxID=3155595 RepID=UPI0033AF34A5